MTYLKSFLLTAIICFLLTIGVTPAWATVKIETTFTAQKTCKAVQSIKEGTNPGNVQVSPQKTYPAIGKNKKDASHYLIKIDGAEPSERWVAINCGQLSANPTPTPTPITPVVNKSSDYLLAVSWQPSFCETKPEKIECIGGNQDNFEAKNLALHGLWPQPEGNDYCNVSKRIKKLDQDKIWSELPPLDLSLDTLNKLRIVMPGVASNLHLHEWYKHGTCYGTSPEQYFLDSIALLTKINNSDVRDLLVDNIGKQLATSEIREKFDEAFGDGAGNKVEVKCTIDPDENETMITELWINLKGKIESDPELPSLLAKAPNTSTKCIKGEVDPIGVNERLLKNVF